MVLGGWGFDPHQDLVVSTHQQTGGDDRRKARSFCYRASRAVTGDFLFALYWHGLSLSDYHSVSPLAHMVRWMEL
jgi:hypothetical protein